MSDYIDNVKLNGVSIPIRDSDAQEKIAQMERLSTGNGIESAVMNGDDSLTLNFTDGTSYTTPSLRGASGYGMPSGGAAGQILRKRSAANYDMEWRTPADAMTVDFGTVNSLPVTKAFAGVTADMVVAAHAFGNPSAFTEDLTVTTASGSVTISGKIAGSSTVRLTFISADPISGT